LQAQVGDLMQERLDPAASVGAHQHVGPFVLGQPEEAWFDVGMMQKDLLLALEAGRELNVPLPTTSIANEFTTAARAMGFADKDFAVVFDVLARMSGIGMEVTS